MAFFEIVSTMFGVLFYAILATMVFMGLLFVLLRAIDKRHVGTIPFFITGIFGTVANIRCNIIMLPKDHGRSEHKER